MDIRVLHVQFVGPTTRAACPSHGLLQSDHWLTTSQVGRGVVLRERAQVLGAVGAIPTQGMQGVFGRDTIPCERPEGGPRATACSARPRAASRPAKQRMSLLDLPAWLQIPVRAALQTPCNVLHPQKSAWKMQGEVPKQNALWVGPGSQGRRLTTQWRREAPRSRSGWPADAQSNKRAEVRHTAAG